LAKKGRKSLSKTDLRGKKQLRPQAVVFRSGRTAYMLREKKKKLFCHCENIFLPRKNRNKKHPKVSLRVYTL
jgi:hypothetical protein